MADSTQSPSTESPPSRPPPVGMNPPNLRSCFICLQNESETPGATWVYPCPCTLEAHEDCMLQWVSETETSGRRAKKSLRCPACNARIRVDEPFDVAVYVRERLHRAYSRASPLVLIDFFLAGVFVGSATYGYIATWVFGGDVARRWLRLRSLVNQTSFLETWLSISGRALVLASLGPVLIIHRALPGLGRMLSLPLSLVYGTTLVALNHVPTWPPSPQWALAAMPCVNLVYTHLYYDLFGDLDRRLNRSLMGRPPADQTAQVAAAEGNANADANANANNNNPDANAGDNDIVVAADDVEEPGLWTTLWHLANAVIGLFEVDEEVVIQAQVRVGGPDHDHEHDEEVEQGLHELELEIEAEEREMQEALEGREPQLEEPVVIEVALEGGDNAAPASPQEAAINPPAADAEEGQAAAEAPDVPGPAQNQNQNQGQGGQAAEGGAVSTTISDIINNMATSLLLPGISWGAGELLRVTLPKAWVTSPVRRGGFRPGMTTAPTGLLQNQWGRSLVGGCLFVVLKDMFVLYAKYRKVQVKGQRKIRNVSSPARRRQAEGRAAAAAASAVTD